MIPGYVKNETSTWRQSRQLKIQVQSSTEMLGIKEQLWGNLQMTGKKM